MESQQGSRLRKFQDSSRGYRGPALAEVDPKHEDRIRAHEERVQSELWAKGVKSQAGWACESCREIQPQLLEAHHNEPKHLCPERALDPDNGQCLCMVCHALAHWDDPVARTMILTRLFGIWCQK
jgi:CHAD domain-containing protein